nr:alpha-E domain-containing protein [Pirellulales bacterium]
GRLIERADKTSRVLDVEHYFKPAAFRFAPPADSTTADPHSQATAPVAPAEGGDEPPGGDAVQWSAVLESASALEMYRKQYGPVVRRNVAEFLIFDRFFPRTMHFCLIKAEESLLAITGGAKGAYTNPAERRLGRLRSGLDYGHIDEVLAGDEGLHEFIDGFQQRLNRASDAVQETFFATRPAGPVAEA